MSDRAIVSDHDKMAAWMRTVDDRLTMLQTRKLQGDLQIDSAGIAESIIERATIAHLQAGIDLTSQLPLTLTGSREFTQSIELLGTPGTSGSSTADVHALVTRDVNGGLVDIWPRPHVQMTTGAALSVPTNFRFTATNAQFTRSHSSPFTFDQTWDDTNAAMVIPVNGFYELFLFCTWTAVADTTVRNITPQFSTVGVSFADHFADTKPNNSGAADLGTHTFSWGKQAYTLGNQIRITGFHRSVTTPLNCSFVRYDMTWMRGNP